ncbi:hypothetical protein Q5H93_16435 [Hymenobacter sp. ASUV-10]|uniref:Uncharacterized protein n=1 Tax=Hymenobacter aranciens TaxID=3063996 RepID=A0ABT9BDJ8_9BACT|nr:hypothetical protein [Hymenobacter sp. ASUV-10]MDO7876334.1 hypothetical protein [Hymenobacter sp. ASUV-10]
MTTKKALRHYEQIDREIAKAASRFSQQLMSNSKWVRLIGKLVEHADKILTIEFKKVQQDRIGQLHLAEDTEFGFDYWQTGFEGCNSLGGWLIFKEIEYLFFPRVIDAGKQLEQDLQQIEAIINSVGQFSLEMDEAGLKLHCYKE